MAMGFNNSNNKSVKEMIINKDFTNGIVFGRTGSGKTSCCILPNIEDRIKSDYGLLIYDFKGNLHLQTKYMANKYNKLSDVIEIGKPWGKSINLCDYLSLKQIPMIAKSNDKSDYWDIASRNLLENVFIIYKNLNSLEKEFAKVQEFAFPYKIKEASYSNIYSYFISVENMKYFYEEMNSNLNFAKITLRRGINNYPKQRSNIIYELIKNIEKSLTSLKLYKNINKDEDNGKNAVVNHLNSILSVIANKKHLNEGDIDIIQELRAGKIVIIDVSSLSENILDAINVAISTRLQKAVYEIMKPVSIIIDEAQKVLSSEYLPQTDVCRESKFEYIFATQDKVLLINKLGSNKFEELYSNLITKYSLNTNDGEHLEEFEYLDLSKNRKSFAQPFFIDRQELIKVEYQFLKINNLLEFVDYQSDEPFIFIYDCKLLEDYKIMIETIGGKFIIVDYLSLSFEIVATEICDDIITINTKSNKELSKLDEVEQYVNSCLKSVARLIQKEKDLIDRIEILENRFDLLTPALRHEEMF